MYYPHWRNLDKKVQFQDFLYFEILSQIHAAHSNLIFSYLVLNTVPNQSPVLNAAPARIGPAFGQAYQTKQKKNLKN